jgi:alpha-ketoglutarate-dependent taurine dioxygenase
LVLHKNTEIMSILKAKGMQLTELETVSIIQQLRQSGLVLLRGFDIKLADFELFTSQLCNRFHDVGTRQSLLVSKGDGYTSNVRRKKANLFAHSEGAYLPRPPPDLCFFNCVQATLSKGGETMLVDGVEFQHRLSASLRERFARQGIIYQAKWDEQRWQTEFAVESQQDLREFLRDHPQCEYKFDGRDIRVRSHAQAIRSTLGGTGAFANGLLAHLPRISHPRWQGLNVFHKDSNRVFFGDGEEIPQDIVNRLIDIQDEIAVDHTWVTNDLLILDNTRYMHGRRITGDEGERVIRSRFGWLKQSSSSSP